MESDKILENYRKEIERNKLTPEQIDRIQEEILHDWLNKIQERILQKYVNKKNKDAL